MSAKTLDHRSPEEKKSCALKSHVQAQSEIELAKRDLLSINPVVSESSQYVKLTKLHTDIRSLIGAISGMRVS